MSHREVSNAAKNLAKVMYDQGKSVQEILTTVQNAGFKNPTGAEYTRSAVEYWLTKLQEEGKISRRRYNKKATATETVNNTNVNEIKQELQSAQSLLSSIQSKLDNLQV